MNHPVVLNSHPRHQTLSHSLQTPFYFGGSQTPNALHLTDFNGSGVKGSPSKTHSGELDYTTKKGDKVYHQKGHFVVKPFNKPYIK